MSYSIAFSNFRDRYMVIYRDYQKYGDRIIDVLFPNIQHDYENKIKESLEYDESENKFLKILEEVWKENFMTVIRSINDLSKVPVNEEISWDSRNCPDIVIDKDFREMLGGHTIKPGPSMTYVMDDSYLYVISFPEYNSFKIERKIDLKRILKSE